MAKTEKSSFATANFRKALPKFATHNAFAYSERHRHAALKKTYVPQMDNFESDRTLTGLMQHWKKTVQNVKRIKGYTPLSLAVKAGHADVVRSLLAMGADPCVVDGTNKSLTNALSCTTREPMRNTLD